MLPSAISCSSYGLPSKLFTNIMALIYITSPVFHSKFSDEDKLPTFLVHVVSISILMAYCFYLNQACPKISYHHIFVLL